EACPISRCAPGSERASTNRTGTGTDSQPRAGYPPIIFALTLPYLWGKSQTSISGIPGTEFVCRRSKRGLHAGTGLADRQTRTRRPNSEENSGTPGGTGGAWCGGLCRQSARGADAVDAAPPPGCGPGANPHRPHQLSAGDSELSEIQALSGRTQEGGGRLPEAG